MSFKFRYASALIGVFVALGGAVWLALQLLNGKQYLLLALLAVALYGAMFFCGRKMAKVFYLLSMLKFLKTKGGLAAKSDCKTFLSGALPKKSSDEIFSLLEEVLNSLVENDLAVIDGDNIVLTSV